MGPFRALCKAFPSPPSPGGAVVLHTSSAFRMSLRNWNMWILVLSELSLVQNRSWFIITSRLCLYTTFYLLCFLIKQTHCESYEFFNWKYRKNTFSCRWSVMELAAKRPQQSILDYLAGINTHICIQRYNSNSCKKLQVLKASSLTLG